MSAANTRPCKACRATIFFAAVAGGKLQVLDAKAPVFELLPDGTCRRADAARFFVSHWSTCPHRDDVKAEQAAKRAAARTEA
jgi:hypothetical protein